MGIKSNNLLAAYHDFFSRSGKDAVGDYVAPPGLQTLVAIFLMEFNLVMVGLTTYLLNLELLQYPLEVEQ